MTATVIPRATAIEAADDALMAAGHGITDLLKTPTARDEATDAALTAGVGPLWQKIAIWRPAAIVFIYKRAASIAAGRHLPSRGATRGCRARRTPVLPDARSLRADRAGRRGAQLPAQPGRRAPQGSRLTARSGGDRPAALIEDLLVLLHASWSSSESSSSSASASIAGRPTPNAASRGQYPTA